MIAINQYTERERNKSVYEVCVCERKGILLETFQVYQQTTGNLVSFKDFM